MASICVVKFDSDHANSVSLVPESCLQSSKHVKVKLNGDYLFVHKCDRQRRLRGKLLFKDQDFLKLILAFPTTQESDYLRRVLAVVDMRSELTKSRTINCGQQLGLSDMELLEATGSGRFPWKKIVVNLIKACFKNVDLQYENYTSLRNLNKNLVDNIL
ncbi:unnamed protein product, partial [Rotaria sp. Silwood2]